MPSEPPEPGAPRQPPGAEAAPHVGGEPAPRAARAEPDDAAAIERTLPLSAAEGRRGLFERERTLPLSAAEGRRGLFERERTLPLSAAEGRRGLFERERTLPLSAAEGRRGLFERERTLPLSAAEGRRGLFDARDAAGLAPAAIPGGDRAAAFARFRHDLAARHGALWRAAAWLGPDFGLVLAFTATLAVLVGAYGGSYKWKEGPIVISAGIAVGLCAVRFLYRWRSIVLARGSARADFRAAVLNILRDWGPIILIMWLFQSLETYTGVVRASSIDGVLYRADVYLFGEEPTVWLSAKQTPLLTDYFALAYGLYFIMPMILATALSLRGRRADFREMTTAVVLQMGIGFFLFLLFPAGPPRYYEPLVHPALGAHGFDPPQLHSFFGLFELQQGAFDSADPVRTRSAFPSLHCSLALLTLIYSYRFSDAVFPRFPRLWFRIVLPFVISLWISVVYLRHHWVVDIFAGLALGTAANLLAPILRRRWPRAVPL